MPQDTFLLSKAEAATTRKRHLIDANGRVLGRLATEAAVFLRGKHKPVYTDFVDCGDYVVVTNAARVKFTGDKINQKTYFSHSGYAGGAKVVPLKRMMEKDPRKVVYLAVKRMLPDNRLRGRQLTRLTILVGESASKSGSPKAATAAKAK